MNAMHDLSLVSRFGHTTLPEALKFAASEFGDQVIVHASAQDGREDIQTYRSLATDANNLAELFISKGWRAGNRLIFVVNDSRLFVTAFWGCLLAGIVPVPLSALMNRDTDSMEAEKIRNVIGITNAQVLIDSRIDPYAKQLTEIIEKAGGRVIYADELVREAPLRHFEPQVLPEVGASDDAVLQFSSGSSGLPKGVRLTHHNIIANIEGQIDATDVTNEDVLCTWLPYFHDFGLFWGHLKPLYLGMKQVRLSPGHFARRPLVWLEKLEAHHATITNTTPTALNHLLGYIELRQKKGSVGPFNLSPLKTMLVGAEMIDPADCRRAITLLAPFGVKDTLIQGGYGLTETTVAATAGKPGTPLRTRILDRTALVSKGKVIDVPAQHPRAAEFASVGCAVSHCEIRIVDERGHPVGIDQVGVVEIRGQNVTTGYFNNPDADKAAFRHDDWFDSGDIGFLDSTGFLTITGRAKEMLLVGGHNYYPWDVEQIVMKSQVAANALRHATVCGFWNPALHREEIVLFFVPERIDETDLYATLADISEHVNTIIGFPIDSFVRMQMRDIPRTSSGKVMRRVLVDKLLDGTHSRLHMPECSQPEIKLTAQRTPDDIRHLLRTLWSEALGIALNEITTDTSLFHLGCNSLKASQIQGRLEDALGQRLETNFNYAHPLLEDQVRHLVARNPGLETPRDEIELILRTIAHDILDIPEYEISMSQSLVAMTKGLSGAMQLLLEIGHVFDLSEECTQTLKGATIRALADEIRALKNIGSTQSRSRFPLMNFQETLYFHRKGFIRNEPSKLSCFIFIALDIESKCGMTIDPHSLGEAFDRVIRQHPMLRAVVDERDDRPHLRILDLVPHFEVKFHDLSKDDPAQIETFLTRRGRELNDVRFDICQWPLFLCELYRRAHGRYTFLFNIDHLLIDGYSFMHLLQEVFATYDAVVDGTSSIAPASSLSFGDYVLIEQARQRTQSYQRAMQRQLSLFENLPPKAHLPFKKDPAAIEDVWFDTYYHVLDANLVGNLTRLASSQGITLNSLLLGVWFKIVNLWSGQDDLVINMPVFNREHYFAGARSVLGTFIDIFPVRVRTGASEPVMGIARKVEEFTRELLSIPVSSIELSRLIAERDNANSGSMSSLIFSNSIGVYGGDLDRLSHFKVTRPLFRTGAPGTFIDLVLYDFEGEYYINWNYVRDLVDGAFIQTLAGQFQDICRRLITPDQQDTVRFDVAEILPAPFRNILADINTTQTSFPRATLQALVAAQADKTPDAVALICKDECMTYRTVMERANQVAHALRKLGVGCNCTGQANHLLRTNGVGHADFVAILFERSIDMVIAQLGILQAGAAYVPVDPEYPRERLNYVIDDCQARVLLTQFHLLDRVSAPLTKLDTVIVLDSPGCDVSVPKPLTLIGSDVVATMPMASPDHSAQPEDLTYMIYTSGSTGQPKGVMIPHVGIVNFLEWARTFHGLSDKDNVALVTSYAFDMTLATNWTGLLCGARVHILHERDTQDVETFLRFLSKQKITFLNITPSHFSLLANAREHLGLGDLPMTENMRIMLGGEVINTKDLNHWLRHYPGHSFVNEYGPTEVSVATTAFSIPVADDGKIAMTTVPIGRPLSNCTAYVLTPCGQPCMPGVAGELCLGGVGVAIGYFNKPERTKAAFVANPFGKEGDRMYRTGDLARIWEDGNIEFLGRRDYQINLRGYRIEAGEVENALMRHPEVSQAVVVAQPDQGGQLQLIAYIVGSGDISAAQLRHFVGEHLPAYMVPAHTVWLEQLPTTPSGKLDRKALPAVRDFSGRSVVDVVPKTGMEHAIHAIWKDVLGLDEIGLDESFWELGGDSLRAMRLIVRYREAGYAQFGLRDVFRFQTIAQTAAYLENITTQTDTGLVTVIRSSSQPRCRLLLLPYACGNASSFIDLAQRLDADIEVLAVSPSEHWNEQSTDMRDMAQQILACMPEANNRLPLVVAGYSFGGVLACEIVSQLEQLGEAPHGVAIISTAPPGNRQEIDLIVKASDEEILVYSRDIYGFDPSTLSASELALYLHQLRAQTAAIGQYCFNLDQPLCTPALVLVGLDEEDMELQRDRARWHALFQHCEQEMLPGRHMLIKTHPDDLAARLSAFIEASIEPELAQVAAE